VRSGALVAVAVAALAAAPPSSESTSRSQTIRLISVGTSSKTVDKAPSGLSAGDKVIETSRLSNQIAQFGKRKGAVVGHDRATLTVVNPTTVRVDGVATLPGGTVVLRGPIKASSATVATVPVGGGTGAFAGARGTVVATQPNPGATRAVNVYRLTLP
jgi:hypothetical protein